MIAHILSEYGARAKDRWSLSGISRAVKSLLGGGVAMGAFCIFGISRTICRATATKKTSTWDAKEARNLSPEEWSARRDELADKLFDETTRRVKVSPELDTPHFCKDWLSVDPGHVRDPLTMVRGPKRDKDGNVVKRNGVVVETWLEYSAECARLGIEVAA